jgi:hypothetical protein
MAKNNLRNSATSAGDKNHPQLNQKNKKQHEQKMLPQSNADQRRNNLRNSATSAGNKNHPKLNQKIKSNTHKKMLPQSNADQRRNNLRHLRHLRETKIIPN